MRLFAMILIGTLATFVAWGSGDLPERGDPGSTASTGVSTYYIENAYLDSQTPNMVTAVLADYRGFDTFGEAVVVVAAGLSCLLILLRRRRREDGTEGGLFSQVDAMRSGDAGPEPVPGTAAGPDPATDPGGPA